MSADVIAIDGPAASGKSTVASHLARLLSIPYVNTGSMYRAVTYAVLQQKIDVSDEAAMKELLNNMQLEYKADEAGNFSLSLNGVFLKDELVTPEVNANVSPVAAIPMVREKLKKLQRSLAEKQRIVMEGRDIGSVIFPNADLKIYMDCDINVRTERRVKQYAKNGIKVSLQKAKQAIAQRDLEDTTRHDSPLIRLPEAFYLDTTNLSMEECVNIVIQQIKLKQNKK